MSKIPGRKKVVQPLGRSLAVRLAGLGALCAVSVAALPALARAQEPGVPAEREQTRATAASAEEIASLRAEIERLRLDYEARIAALEARLAELEAPSPAAEAVPEPTAEPAPADLEALRAAALAAAAAESEAATAAPPGEAVARGGLNRLNPEISVTGNVLGIASDAEREEISLQEFELDLQSNLDPFTRMRLTLAFEGEEVDIEEGYVAYPSLPGGLELSLGRFRQQLGAVNRQHLHALPQVEYPLVLRTLFGEEGLAQTGVSARWLLPRPWADANEITLQVTDGESEFFAGEDFERLSLLSHLKSYWDLGDAAYFEWGLTGATGETGERGDAWFLGADLTYHWQPPALAKYRELTWRTEVLRARRDDLAGVAQEAWGGYSYLEALLRRNLHLGLRLDYAEDPRFPADATWGVAPYLTWWQSEYVRLRAQLDYLEPDVGEAVTRFALQLTWAAGPHKHETY
jgi:hypothetical protein